MAPRRLLAPVLLRVLGPKQTRSPCTYLQPRGAEACTKEPSPLGPRCHDPSALVKDARSRPQPQPTGMGFELPLGAAASHALSKSSTPVRSGPGHLQRLHPLLFTPSPLPHQRGMIIACPIAIRSRNTPSRHLCCAARSSPYCEAAAQGPCAGPIRREGYHQHHGTAAAGSSAGVDKDCSLKHPAGRQTLHLW